MPRYLVEPNKKYSMSLIVGNRRKNGPKPFFFGTIAFFLKNLVLDFLGPTKKDHIDCTKLVEKHCGPLYIVH